MRPIEFTIPHEPIAQPRQRHRIVGAGRNAFIQNYTPSSATVNTFKSACKIAARSAYTGKPLTGPLLMQLVCVFARPEKLRWKTKPMPRLPHAKKPDRDNVAKAVQDALESIVYKNDSQICGGEIVKMIASGDEVTHVFVKIETAPVE